MSLSTSKHRSVPLLPQLITQHVLFLSISFSFPAHKKKGIDSKDRSITASSSPSVKPPPSPCPPTPWIHPQSVGKPAVAGATCSAAEVFSPWTIVVLMRLRLLNLYLDLFLSHRSLYSKQEDIYVVPFTVSSLSLSHLAHLGRRDWSINRLLRPAPQQQQHSSEEDFCLWTL